MGWLTRLVRRSRADKQLDSELRFHLEQQIAEYLASGMPPDEARRRARLEFGGLDQVKERVHAAHRGHFIETLLQDIRYGLRMLRKSPGFTAVAIITLALGIGANTAIFSVMNALLLRPLPVREPRQLVQFSESDAHGNKYLAFAHPTFEEVARNNRSLDGVAAFLYLPRPVPVIFEGRAQLASAMLASHDYFSVLGITALQGRVFTPSDRTASRDHLAVISYGYWTRRFNQDPKIIGASISINESLFTIIGVTPADFYGVQIGRSPDLTIPETMQPQLISVGGQSFLDNPNVRWIEIIARLKRGTAAQAAQADLSRIIKRIDSKKSNSLRFELVPFAKGLDSNLRGRFALPLQILLALTMLV
ncbi:MAG TPA: ABC transporter permease, partial [Candidatus Acidoferrales bacterium]|nr:ABC transporter permease [Candidatus Acidoferrales bacterium]